jgi:phosphocarrier protein HPr
MSVVHDMAILNERGLHARAAAKFVKLAAEFDADITVGKDGSDVSGESIMGLMMLAAAKGTVIRVTADGADAAPAIAALAELVGRKFDER